MQRSFYYWKSGFRLTSAEREAVKQLDVKKLYVKFFDVDWSEQKQSAEPVAKSIFHESPPQSISITPVVFITQEPLLKLDTTSLNRLATNIAGLLSSITANNKLILSQEIQLDCDWSAKTKGAYFHLLKKIKEQPFFQRKILSVTVRLHQLKFLSQNGVPPVEKGLLMCYNMGNLRNAKTANSILEEDELKKYISHLQNYPLPLDIAVPIFDWYILFDGNLYKGLLRDFKPSATLAKKHRIHFERDTTIDGYSFRSGQWIRHEKSEAEVIKACAERISKKLKSKELTVILYHLDQGNLSNYHQNELESFYNSFH